MGKIINVVKKGFFSFVWIIVLVFALDITSKWIVQTHLSEYQQVVVIKDFFSITLTHNLGAAWSFGSSGTIAMRIVWILVSVILTGALSYYLFKAFKKMSYAYRIAICLMIGGAFSNLIDRAFYWNSIVGFDGVIDWLAFRLFNSYDFPVFNIADSALVIGTAILIVLLVIELINDAIKKNRDGAYSLKPKDYEAKVLEEENKEQKNDEKN